MHKFVSTLSTFDLNPLSIIMNSQRYVDEVEIKISETSAKIGIPKLRMGSIVLPCLPHVLLSVNPSVLVPGWTFCTYKIFIIYTRLIIVYFTNCKEI